MGVIEDAGPEHLSFEREDFPPVCVMVPACVRVAEGNRELAGRVALTGHLGLDDIRIPAETMPGMRANNMATNSMKLYLINGDSLPRCFEPSNGTDEAPRHSTVTSIWSLYIHFTARKHA